MISYSQSFMTLNVVGMLGKQNMECPEDLFIFSGSDNRIIRPTEGADGKAVTSCSIDVLWSGNSTSKLLWFRKLVAALSLPRFNDCHRANSGMMIRSGEEERSSSLRPLFLCEVTT